MGHGSARAAGRVVLAAVSAGVVAALTGCVTGGGAGSGDDPGSGPEVPMGFQRVQAGPVTLAVPATWRRGQAPQGWSGQWTFTTAAGDTDAQAGVITDVPQTDDVKAVATAAWAGTLLNAPGLQRGKDQHITVPGADAAIRVDFSYTERPSATPLPARGMDLSVVYGEAKAFTVRVTGLQKTLAPPTVKRIAASVTVQVRDAALRSCGADLLRPCEGEARAADEGYRRSCAISVRAPFLTGRAGVPGPREDVEDRSPVRHGQASA